jgi:isopenicillin N synthase-like dioxygenase
VAYYEAMSRLAAVIMQMLATALDLRADFFAGKTACSISALRLLNYPPNASKPLPGQLRAGAHTDYGSLTILLPDPHVDGLQIQAGGREWLPVAAVDGAFVINLGDLMARWTNDTWTSTKHRVRVPTAEMRSVPRVSIPFFHHPNWSAVIECLPSCATDDRPPRYESVTAGEYLLGKAAATYT